MPPLDLRESDEGTATPEPGDRLKDVSPAPPLPAYGPNVAVMRVSSASPTPRLRPQDVSGSGQYLRARSASPPLPPYDPSVAVDRVTVSGSDRIRRDDSFSPEVAAQPMSISTAAVTGHHGLDSSRMIEDFETAAMMDHEALIDIEERDTPEIVYEE